MITFVDPQWLFGLSAVVLAVLMLVFSAWRRRWLLRRFVGEPSGTSELCAGSDLRRWVKGTCVCLSVGAVAIALARPATDPKPQKVERSGRDLVVLLDVSRSMLATDLRPSRLERAKLIIRDLLDAARGDRVAVIAFAGSTVIRCPLTTDYSFARLTLESITPETVTKGGTLIGDAIRAALEDVFIEGDDRYRDILLITDGEDHESDPLQAARAAGARGIRIIAVGLGSELQGATIPVDPRLDGDAGTAGVLTYQGSEVQTRMDTKSLRDIAEASRDGVFLNVGTGTIQMDKVYRTLVERAERRELDSTEQVKYTELFQFAIGAAILLLAMESIISERRRRGSTQLDR